MNVIFDKQAAEQLAEKYTILPLPPITQTEGDKTVTVEPHVVIDLEKVTYKRLLRWTNGLTYTKN